MLEARQCENPQWFTAEQVAGRLNVRLEELITWRNQGKGPPWLEIGDEVWYNEADLLHWIEAGAV